LVSGRRIRIDEFAGVIIFLLVLIAMYEFVIP